jgi:hypothetical protein
MNTPKKYAKKKKKINRGKNQQKYLVGHHQAA